MNTLTTTETPTSPFEHARKYDAATGREYWSARELCKIAGYTEWRNFDKTVERAKKSCKTFGCSPAEHLVEVNNPLTGGNGAVQLVKDYELTRYACSLIFQNGDADKPVIAAAQAYFAFQTRRQELADAGIVTPIAKMKLVAEMGKILKGTLKGLTDSTLALLLIKRASAETGMDFSEFKSLVPQVVATDAGTMNATECAQKLGMRGPIDFNKWAEANGLQVKKPGGGWELTPEGCKWAMLQEDKARHSDKSVWCIRWKPAVLDLHKAKTRGAK